MIKTRREACHKWKNEKDNEKKRKYEEENKKIRCEVINEIERCEGERIKGLIDEGKETIDFWKLMKRIKKGKKDKSAKAIKDEDGIIQKNSKDVLEIKRRYYEKLYASFFYTISPENTKIWKL